MAGVGYAPLPTEDPGDYDASAIQGQDPIGQAEDTTGADQSMVAPLELEGAQEAPGSEDGPGMCIDKETGIAPRRCTDMGCCFIFLVKWILLLTCLGLSRWHGNIDALTRGRDYYGRVCGSDNGVENLPWLFWCRDDAPNTGTPQNLNLVYPSCVATCPARGGNSSIPIACLARFKAPVKSNIPGGQFGNVATETVALRESVIYTVPYATKARGGRFCMPSDINLQNVLLGSWNALHPFGRIMRSVTVGTLSNLYWIFLLNTIISIAAGYFFLFSMQYCSKSLPKIFCFPGVALCMFVFVYLVFAVFPLINASWGISSWYMGWNSLYKHFGVQVASWTSLALLIPDVLCGTMLYGMAANFTGMVVGDLIGIGMTTIRSVPGMYYIPAIEGFMKFLVFLFFLDGFRWFFTIGILRKNLIHVNGIRLAGLSRTWGWDYRYIFICILWLIGFYWSMEICTAFGQFLVSHATVKYHYTPKDGFKKKMLASPLPVGVKEGFLYNFGSICRGAWLIPPWRPIRLLYWALYEISPDEGADPQTFLGKTLKFLSCGTGCFGLAGGCGLRDWSKERLGFGDSEEDPLPEVKDGFTDVVIRANDFKNGSDKAHLLLEQTHKAVQYYYRDLSQTTLCVLGVSSIASISAFVVFCITSFEPSQRGTFGYIFGYNDPSSPMYIANPALVVVLSWILSAYIAFGFMSIWDHSADTLLFCYVFNRKFSYETLSKYVPESVRAMVGYDDEEEERPVYYGRAKESMYLRSWIPVKEKKAEEEGAKPLYEGNSTWFAGTNWMASHIAAGQPQNRESL
jgi:hypothetical protein